MQLTLVIPELIWPEVEDGVLDRADCPALATLLARCRLSERPPQSLEATLADALSPPSSPAPYAVWRLLGEGDTGGRPAEVDDGCWLCCDPVHLHFHQQHMILADSGSFAITLAEARSLADELERQLPELGHFHVAAADRWYLRLADPTLADGLQTRPLSLVAGRRVDHLLPETTASRALRSRLNEAQMLLHAHPVNAQREAAGALPINSLWLWGAGTLDQSAQSPAQSRTPSHAEAFAAVWADTPLALGLARQRGAQAHKLPADADALLAQATRGGHHLALLDALHVAVQYENGDDYRAALAQVDARWIAPLRAALAAGRIDRLRIEAPTAYATLTWQSTRGDQWKLWRRARPLAALARALAAGG